MLATIHAEHSPEQRCPTDGGASVRNISLTGLMSSQVYSTWSSASNPDFFLAGTQDQGFQQSVPPRGGRAGAPLSTIQQIVGDYGNLTSGSHDLSKVFALYPGLLLYYAPDGDPASSVLVP